MFDLDILVIPLSDMKVLPFLTFINNAATTFAINLYSNNKFVHNSDMIQRGVKEKGRHSVFKQIISVN